MVEPRGRVRVPVFLPRVVALVCAPSLLWWRSSSACMPVYGPCSIGNTRSPPSICRLPASRTLRSPDRSTPTTATSRRRNRSAPTSSDPLYPLDPYYSSTGGVGLVPIATQFGLKVTLGIWLNKRKPATSAKSVGDRARAPTQHIARSWSAADRAACRTVGELIRLVQRVNG